ncbi:MAG: tryptophan--tRNA ligase [Nitrososphaerota archaeon]|nr:tryptophan--tRNA ligase [Nitrososphaerota archaeon]
MEREVRLVEEFGLRNISQQDVGVDHYFVRRGLIFAVRGYEEFKEALQSGDFYTLTGIMPSSERIHLGTMAVVEALKCFAEKSRQMVLLIADLESLATRSVDLAEARKTAFEFHIPTYLALGINPDSCVFYFQSENPDIHKIAADASREITLQEFRAVYGALEPARIVSSLYQIGDILFPQLVRPMVGVIPVGLDQDPHIRLCRDYVRRSRFLKFKQAVGVYIRDVPSLKGEGKMSKSEPHAAIFLPEDDIRELRRKVYKAFSGGADTLEEQRKYGADLERDVPFKILQFILKDDSELRRIAEDYSSGRMISGEVKEFLFQRLVELMQELQSKIDYYRDVVRRGEIRIVKTARELAEYID